MPEQQFTTEDLAVEEWRDIPDGVPGWQVSNLGRVRSCRAVGPTPPGQIFNRRPDWRLLHPQTFAPGYPFVCFRRRRQFVHAMVLTAFVGPRPKGMDCCHADDVKTNNRLSNLRWDTRKANFADRKKNGIDLAGERHSATNLTNDVVLEMRRVYAAGLTTARELSAQHGICVGAIQNILTGKRFSSVPGHLSPEPGRKKIGPIFRGDTSPAAKLTEQKVIAMRQEWAKGEATQKELALKYGVTVHNVFAVVHRKTWRHIA